MYQNSPGYFHLCWQTTPVLGMLVHILPLNNPNYSGIVGCPKISVLLFTLSEGQWTCSGPTILSFIEKLFSLEVILNKVLHGTVLLDPLSYGRSGLFQSWCPFTVEPPNKDTLGPAVLSFVGRLSSSWRFKMY